MNGKNVLVVDDCRSQQRLIEGILKQTGLSVTSVDSAEDALKSLGHILPDLLVLDVVMPGQSGFDLCRHLRSLPATENLPVIFCTSKGQEFDRFWGMRQGGTAYITKPFAPHELINAVKSCLSTHTH